MGRLSSTSTETVAAAAERSRSPPKRLRRTRSSAPCRKAAADSAGRPDSQLAALSRAPVTVAVIDGAAATASAGVEATAAAVGGRPR